VILPVVWTIIAPLLACQSARGREPMTVLYTPAKEDFLPEYKRDLANNKRQSWGEYWRWIQDFYKGNLLADGWTRISERMLAAVKSRENRQALTHEFNTLGRLLSREWAKDGVVRRITTTDLRRWNATMTEAVRTDDGRGELIKKALAQVREQAEKQLGSLQSASGPLSTARAGRPVLAEVGI
jgi:hypothetical protein